MFSHFRIVLISIITLSLSFSTTLLNVDFETEGSGYTPSATEGSGWYDVFNRSNPNKGGNETYMWAFEDFSTGFTDPTITLDQINVSGYESFSFSIDMLAHHMNDWDNGSGADNLKMFYSLDGGEWQNLMWVLPLLGESGAEANEPAALDADFDGVSECDHVLPSLSLGTGELGCVVSSDLFQTFTTGDFSLNNTSTLDIKLEFTGFSENDAGGYLDNIVVSGTLPSGATCDEETACNYGSEGACTYADTNEDCAGNCLDGFPADCAGVCGGSTPDLDTDGICDSADDDDDGDTITDDVDCDDSDSTVGAAAQYYDCAGVCLTDADSDSLCDEVDDCVEDPCGTCGGDGTACMANIFFSEAGEGSSNNKYWEIYNATDAVVDLSLYSLSSCSNGCDTVGQWDYPNNLTFDSGTTVDSGDVFVICNSQSSSEILAQCDLQTTWYYYSTGDDVFALTHVWSGSVIDVVGMVGEAPQAGGWDVAGVAAATKDHTLVRKSSVLTGNPLWLDNSDTGEQGSAGDDADDSEWIVYDQNTWDYIGSHTYDGPATDVAGCMDSIAQNYNPDATEQSYNEYGTSTCIYTSCSETPYNEVNTCLWADGTSSQWWDGPWNCAGGTACGYSQVDFSVDADWASSGAVNGNFNDWCGSCNALGDADGDGVWTGSVWLLANDDTNPVYEYKFTMDGNNWETLTEGDSCTLTTTDDTGTFTNRTLIVEDTDINTVKSLSTVCFGSCDACPVTDICAGVTCEAGSSCDSSTGTCVADPTPSDVTFTIDGLDDCAYASITGNFGTAWNGWGTALCDEGAGTACEASNSATVSLDDGSYDFQIVCVPNGTAAGWWTDIDNGLWSQFALTVDSGDCWNGDSVYTNYTFTVDGADLTVAHCAGSCDATCPTQASADLRITGIFDGDMSGGKPKGIELFASSDISDLSIYSIQQCNNGDPCGNTFTLSGSASAGSYLYITANTSEFTEYFGFDADFYASSTNVNGDDAITLNNSADLSVVDMVGLVGLDGTGEDWEYKDGWGYRLDGSGPTSAFDVSEWTFCKGCLDNIGGNSNSLSDNPFPVGTFSTGPAASCTDASDCDDSNDYTADSCVEGVCTHVTLDCLVDSDCDDNNACTFDSCDQDNTCAHDIGNVGGACDDGDGFTENDVCDDSGSCSGTALSTVNVTFNLDLSFEGADSPQVRVSHGCVAGCDAAFSEGVLDIWLDNTWEDMTDTDGDGVWSYTVALASGVDHTYSYKNGGYESPADDQTCFDDPYGNARHVTPGDSDLSLDPICWNSCTACPDTVPGCTDDTAVNYNPNANEDDGSCLSDWPTPDNLYFSEHAEGSSYNKYVEIYNATGAAVDLSWYSISSCSNGCDYECIGAEASAEQACIDAGGTWDNPNWDYPDNVTFDDNTLVAAGDVYVVCDDRADAQIVSECDQTFRYLSNGDDVIALTQMGSGAILDIVGTIGDDPGDGWNVAGTYNGTKDHTLVRKSSVTTGNGGQWALSAGLEPSDSEWEVQPKNSWGTLGSHPHAFGCLDSNASNYDTSAQFQNYNQYGTSYCTYTSCEDTPTYVDATSNTCLWADGTSSNWWEGPWNCGDGTACGYAKVNFSVSATSSASVAASFNEWNADSNPLGDADADGVFDGPVWLLPGDYEYKFVVDGSWESLTPGLDCTLTTGDYTNRTLSLAASDASSDVNLSTVCAESCYACGFDSCADVSCESWQSCVDPNQAGAVCECIDNGGNVNGLGDINVTDIVALVGWILGCSGDATCFTAEQVCNGDLNDDGDVNVIDVTALVNIILADRISYDDATSANIVLTNNTISVNSDGYVAGVQMTLSHGSNFSLDLEDSYVSEYSTIGNKTTLLLVATGNSLEEIATYKGSFEVESIVLCNSNDEIFDVNVINVNSVEVKLTGPNPFNPSTSLNIVVAQDGFVSVNVYNLVGQKVATLLNDYMDANLNGYPVNFNGSNLASGVYLVRAETAGNVSTQKLMLLK